jgi:hypothetical protein
MVMIWVMIVVIVMVTSGEVDDCVGYSDDGVYYRWCVMMMIMGILMSGDMMDRVSVTARW